jgi:hypothetical protein
MLEAADLVTLSRRIVAQDHAINGRERLGPKCRARLERFDEQGRIHLDRIDRASVPRFVDDNCRVAELNYSRLTVNKIK